MPRYSERRRVAAAECEATNTRITDATQSLKVGVRPRQGARLREPIRIDEEHEADHHDPDEGPADQEDREQDDPPEPEVAGPDRLSEVEDVPREPDDDGRDQSAIALITRMPMPTRPKISPPTKPWRSRSTHATVDGRSDGNVASRARLRGWRLAGDELVQAGAGAPAHRGAQHRRPAEQQAGRAERLPRPAVEVELVAVLGDQSFERSGRRRGRRWSPDARSA